MIEIKCAAPDVAATLCARAGVAPQTVCVMTEREALLGFLCMTLQGEEVTLTYGEAPDLALTDALLRTALNTARHEGAVTAVISCKTLRAHMLRKGYVGDSLPMCVGIANFFAKSACNA